LKLNRQQANEMEIGNGNGNGTVTRNDIEYENEAIKCRETW